ncbi:MAG: hypothetical protein ABJK11_07720 [Balneola sp.]
MFSETIVLKSNRDSLFIKHKLKQDVEPSKFRFFYICDKIFEGFISDSHFEITTSNKNYRNSFSPHVKGFISEASNDVKIHLNLRLHPFVFALTGLINLVFVVTTIGLVLHQISNSYFEPTTALLIICLFTGIILPLWGYRKDRKLIIEYFELNFCNSMHDKLKN